MSILTAELDRSIHTQIKKDRDAQPVSSADRLLYRRYIRGESDVTLTEEQKAVLSGLKLDDNRKYSNNIGFQIVKEARDRLRFESWECEEESVKQWLDDLYDLENIGDRQNQIHFDTLNDGEHVVAIDDVVVARVTTRAGHGRGLCECQGADREDRS